MRQIVSKNEEREMSEAFQKQADEILSETERFTKRGDDIIMGFESEIAIIDRFPPDDKDIESIRDRIIAEIPEFTDREIGASHIEFRTPPVNVKRKGGFGKIRELYKKIFGDINDAVKRNGCSIVRCGTNPFLPAKTSLRTNKLKYVIVPNFYNVKRRKNADLMIGTKDRVDIGDASVEAIFQAFQVNLQASSFKDAIDKMNRSFGIAPYLAAMSGNSRFIEGKDTGMNDLRILPWEKSFDTRTEDELRNGDSLRIGLPEKYFDSMQEYLTRCGRFPFIMYDPENAIRIAIGMTWLDARVKFIENSVVVELRLLSTQPTSDEELLLALLYLGKLSYSQTYNEPMLPLEFIRENRLAAILHGLDSEMWFMSSSGPQRRLFLAGFIDELDKIKRGLKIMEILEYLDETLLSRNLRDGTPSDRLAREFERSKKKTSLLRMQEAMQKTGMII